MLYAQSVLRDELRTEKGKAPHSSGMEKTPQKRPDIRDMLTSSAPKRPKSSSSSEVSPRSANELKNLARVKEIKAMTAADFLSKLDGLIPELHEMKAVLTPGWINKAALVACTAPTSSNGHTKEILVCKPWPVGEKSHPAWTKVFDASGWCTDIKSAVFLPTDNSKVRSSILPIILSWFSSISSFDS